MVAAPTHVGPLPEPGSAQPGAVLSPPLRCSAPTVYRDGCGAHTRGAPARAGLGPAGSTLSRSVACRAASEQSRRWPFTMNRGEQRVRAEAADKACIMAAAAERGRAAIAELEAAAAAAAARDGAARAAEARKALDAARRRAANSAQR